MTQIFVNAQPLQPPQLGGGLRFFYGPKRGNTQPLPPQSELLNSPKGPFTLPLPGGGVPIQRGGIGILHSI